MPDEEQIRRNANRLIEIVLADPDPVRARELIRPLIAENPELARHFAENAIRLDSPDFILGQMLPDELAPFLQTLQPSVLSWLSGFNNKAKEIVQNAFPGSAGGMAQEFKNRTGEERNRNAADEPEQPGKRAHAQEFYDMFREAWLNGDISFDTGLVFGNVFRCSGQKNTFQSPYGIIAFSRILHADEIAMFVLTGRPGETVNFTIQWGEEELLCRTVSFGQSGVSMQYIPVLQIDEKIPAKGQSNGIFLCAFLRDTDIKEENTGTNFTRPFLAYRTCLYSRQKTNERRKLSLRVHRTGLAGLENGERFSQKLTAEISVMDEGQSFRGELTLALRCMACGSGIASYQKTFTRSGSGNPKTDEMEFSIEDHTGPFLLTATAAQTGRMTSCLLEDIYHHTASGSANPESKSAIKRSWAKDIQNGINITSKPEIAMNENIEFAVELPGFAEIFYWLEPFFAPSAVAPQLAGYETLATDSGSLRRSAKYIFSLHRHSKEEANQRQKNRASGSGDHRSGHGYARTLLGETGQNEENAMLSVSLPNRLPPEQYRICILAVRTKQNKSGEAGQKKTQENSALKTAPLSVRHAMRIVRPRYFRATDRVNVRVEIPENEIVNVLDHQKKQLKFYDGAAGETVRKGNEDLRPKKTGGLYHISIPLNKQVSNPGKQESSQENTPAHSPGKQKSLQKQEGAQEDTLNKEKKQDKDLQATGKTGQSAKNSEHENRYVLYIKQKEELQPVDVWETVPQFCPGEADIWKPAKKQTGFGSFPALETFQNVPDYENISLPVMIHYLASSLFEYSHFSASGCVLNEYANHIMDKRGVQNDPKRRQIVWRRLLSLYDQQAGSFREWPNAKEDLRLTVWLSLWLKRSHEEAVRLSKQIESDKQKRDAKNVAENEANKNSQIEGAILSCETLRDFIWREIEPIWEKICEDNEKLAQNKEQKEKHTEKREAQQKNNARELLLRLVTLADREKKVSDHPIYKALSFYVAFFHFPDFLPAIVDVPVEYGPLKKAWLRLLKKELPTESKLVEVPNPAVKAWDQFQHQFTRQGGVTLFGSTEGTAMLLEVLLQLEKINVTLAFQKLPAKREQSASGLLPEAVEQEKREGDIIVSPFPNRWEMGQPRRIFLQIAPRPDLYLRIFCPAHCDMSSPDFFIRDFNQPEYEIALEEKSRLLLEFTPFLTGSSELVLSLHRFSDSKAVFQLNKTVIVE